MRFKTKQEVKDFFNTKKYSKKQSYLEGDNNNQTLQIKKGCDLLLFVKHKTYKSVSTKETQIQEQTQNSASNIHQLNKVLSLRNLYHFVPL